MIKIMKPDFEFNDDRGKLTQLVREGFQQINVIESKAGITRGGHYHKKNCEAFFVVSGKFDLLVEKEGKIKEYQFEAGDMFLIPAYMLHSFTYIKDTVLVGLYDHGVELADGTKDMFTPPIEYLQ